MNSVRASRADVRERLAVAWASGGQGRRAGIVVAGTIAAALAGAFLFGGFVKGNWRAGAFGVALAAVSAALIAGEAALARRLLR